MFQSLLGHERIKQQLQKDVESGQFRQSYLFAGPEHLGKMSLIREMMAQVRTGQPFDPDSAFGQQVQSGQGPGLMVLADMGESLKVDQVRQISEFVSRRTAAGSVSFCVVEHVERMTRSAANAFLKILEEPSERFVYLMTTRYEKKLLPTILSRVQMFRFRPLQQHLVRQFLEQRVTNPVMLDELMKLSVGKVGLALTMFENEAVLDRHRELYDYAMVLFENDLVDRFTLADHLTKKDVAQAELQQFLVYLALKLQQEGTQRHLPQLDRVQELHRLFADTQVNKRLFLEEMFLRI